MAAVLGGGTALGIILGVTAFTVIGSRGVEPLIAIPLSLMAFSFGFIVISMIVTVAMVVTTFLSRRR